MRQSSLSLVLATIATILTLQADDVYARIVLDPVCQEDCIKNLGLCMRKCPTYYFGAQICKQLCLIHRDICTYSCQVPTQISTAKPPVSSPPVEAIQTPTAKPPTPSLSAVPIPAKTPVVHTPVCGRSNNNRIVGGTTSTRCEYPWMVLLYNWATNSVCGGSIIGPRLILTAGHCVKNRKTGYMAKANSFTVYSGSSDMPLGDAMPSADLRRNYVQAVYPHPDYISNGRHDIALLRLTKDLPNDNCHMPVCLVNGTEIPQHAHNCRVMGWGTTSNKARARTSSILKWTDVTVTSDRKCMNIYGESATFCAVGRNADSCKGDSGGPLVCRGPNNSFYQHGIVSRGLAGMCGTVPGLYTRVSSFLPWIMEYM